MRIRFLSPFFIAMLVASTAVVLAAQDSAKAPAKGASTDSPSRWDIFAGYSYLSPKGTVNVLQPDGVTVLPERFKLANAGVIMSGAYFFNKYVGAQLEGASHDTWVNSSSSNGSFATISGGLIARF